MISAKTIKNFFAIKLNANAIRTIYIMFIRNYLRSQINNK